jgi:aminopeptidase YwaD
MGRKTERITKRTMPLLVVLLIGLLWAASSCGNPADTTTSLAVTPTTAVQTTTTGASTTTIASTTTSTQASTTTSTDASTTSTQAAPQPVLAFDSAKAMLHVKSFAKDIGVRRGGTAAENEAAQYALEYLSSLGYEVTVTDVPIPNGLTSHNVVAVKKGSSPLTVIVAGHTDSKKPAPGANDNASGSAAVLELARDVADAAIVPTVIFILFGNEEMIDSNPDHHHYGSRAYVAQMTDEERANLVAMISLDVIAYGDTFTVRTMGKGPSALRDMLQAHARDLGVSLKYLKDNGSAGMSDHEPFELAGYPAVWLEWRDDPAYHTAKDTYEHCNPARIRTTGELVLSFLDRLTPGNLEDLKAAMDARPADS